MTRKIKATIALHWREFVRVMRNEYKHIFTDGGVVLVMVGAIFIYSTIYSLAYGNEVLRNIPIGVVDMSQTQTSRSLAHLFDAGPNTYVAYNPTSMKEAEDLFFARKIYGVVYIPDDYEEKILGGMQATVSLYLDASYFLMYRQVFQEVVAGLMQTGTQVEFLRLVAKGATIPAAQAVANPVIYETHNLFNPYLGYGTFIMPAIIIVIIQQTLLIGIGMIGGTWRELGLYKSLAMPGRKRLSMLPVVLGKSVVYLSIYAFTVSYALGFHYWMFGYPMNGSLGTILLFLLPYMLACIFLGIALSTLFRYRENSILWLLWSSIPILLLSGASLPREAIPGWLLDFGKIFPSSSGVEGFLRIQTMGASLDDVLPELKTLWALAAIYLALACIGIRHVLRKQEVI